MNNVLTAALQIIVFLVQNEDTVKGLIMSAEKLLPDGNSKAAAVKQYIGVALGIADQLEQAWPAASMFFNGYVAKVKAQLPAQAAQ